SFSIPASAAILPVVGGVGAIGAVTVVTGVITATTFFSAATDQVPSAGDNQFFTITKTADPTKIDNSALPKDINFKITLTNKDTRLTKIQLNDKMTVHGKGIDFEVNADK